MPNEELHEVRTDEVFHESHSMRSDDASRISMEHRLEQVNERLAALQAAIHAAVADSRYARQRAEADLAQVHRFGIESFARSLLPFKDALEAAHAVDTNDVHALRTGLELSLRQLQAAFEKNGLTEICPAPGEPFDAQQHRPLVKLGGDDAVRTVACTEQKGYALDGRVLRPAFVTLR